MVSLTQIVGFLDSPKYNWKAILTGFTVAQFLFENYLSYRQYQVLKRQTPPATLKDEVTQETFDKSQDYSRAKLRFGFFSDVYGVVENLAYLRFDGLAKIWSLSGTLLAKAAPYLPQFFSGTITQSVFFFLVSHVISTVVHLPIGYYSHFVLEEKYGFNKQTIKLWVTDHIKSFFLAAILGSPLIAAFIYIIDTWGDKFILYTSIFFLVFQLLAQTLFPLLIQPLFNKFTPLEEGELRTAIEALAARLKFPLDKLYVIDGSARSSHSNAYFTGLPWSKQIVIYDTLIETSTTEETVAVLAHELGHWSKGHIFQMLVSSQLYIVSVFTLFSGFYRNKSFYNSFGFNTTPTLIGFTLFNDLLRPLDCGYRFLNNILLRKNEYEADAFAVELGYADKLSVSLIKLLITNLSTMDADWLYSAYHHSHPILAERLAATGYVSEGKVKKEK